MRGESSAMWHWGLLRASALALALVALVEPLTHEQALHLTQSLSMALTVLEAQPPRLESMQLGLVAMVALLAQFQPLRLQLLRLERQQVERLVGSPLHTLVLQLLLEQLAALVEL